MPLIFISALNFPPWSWKSQTHNPGWAFFPLKINYLGVGEFRATLDCTWCLWLVLYSGITPESAQGTIFGARDCQLESSPCTISPIDIFTWILYTTKIYMEIITISSRSIQKYFYACHCEDITIHQVAQDRKYGICENKELTFFLVHTRKN